MSGKKRWCFFVGVTLVFFLLLYLFLIEPAQKKFRLSHSEVANKTVTLRSFLTRPEGLPTKKEIGSLDNEVKILEEKYMVIGKTFIPETSEKLGITPVEFGKILHETKRKMLRETKAAGLEIPADLGFKETIPTEEEVADMAKELKAITFVIGEGIAFRSGDIKKIKYFGVKADDPWEKVGIELEVSGRFGDIVKFLYSLSQREKIYIIKSLEITKGAEVKAKEAASYPKLKATAMTRKTSAEKEEAEKEKLSDKIAEDRVSVIIHLESYTYNR